jgi:hypothetical protein
LIRIAFFFLLLLFPSHRFNRIQQQAQIRHSKIKNQAQP